jgi:hypothetical protein
MDRGDEPKETEETEGNYIIDHTLNKQQEQVLLVFCVWEFQNVKTSSFQMRLPPI